MKRSFSIGLVFLLSLGLILGGCGGGGGGGAPQYTLTVDVLGDGTIELDPAGGSYEAGTVVTLTPHAGTGSAFSAWSGDHAGQVAENDGIYQIAMDGDRNLVAEFVKIDYAVNIAIVPEGAGTVSISVVEEEKDTRYEHGTVVRLVPQAETGYRFDRWEGDDAPDITEAGGEWWLVVDGDKNITAVFQTLATLTITNDGHGTTNPSGDLFVEDGASTGISAAPNAGYYFVNWTQTGGAGSAAFGDAAAADTTVVITGGSAVIQANFALIPRFIAAGGNGTNGVAYYSTDDGVNWTGTNPGGVYLSDITYGNGRFVAIGNEDVAGAWQAKSWWSPDGVSWQASTLGSGTISSIAYGGGRFVAVGANGKTYWSADGTDWTDSSPGGLNFQAVAYGDGRFVAVSLGGQAWSSTDGGENWTSSEVVFDTSIYGITYGNGLFVAVGANGRAWRSADGIIWSGPVSMGSFILSGIAYGGGRFVAVGAGGKAYWSADGSSWTDGSPGGADLYAVAYGNGKFVAAGDSGRVSWSTDGSAWTDLATVPNVFNFQGIAFGP